MSLCSVLLCKACCCIMYMPVCLKGNWQASHFFKLGCMSYRVDIFAVSHRTFLTTFGFIIQVVLD